MHPVFKAAASAAAILALLSGACSHEERVPAGETAVSVTAKAEGRRWAVGDSLLATLSGGGTTTLKVTSVRSDGQATLQGILPAGKALEGYAVFPWGKHMRHAASLTIDCPSTYAGTGNHAILAAQVTKGASHLVFKPVGGTVSVTAVSIPSIARKAALTVAGKAIGGRVSATPDENGDLVAWSREGEDTLRITFEPGATGPFVFPVPAGTEGVCTCWFEDAAGRPLRYTAGKQELAAVSPSATASLAVSFPVFHTPVAEALYGFSDAVVEMFPDDQALPLADGVIETDVHFTKKDGTPIHAFVIEADLSLETNHLRIGAPMAQVANFGKKRQTLSAQAPYYESATQRPVVIVNADFWAVNGTYKDQLRGPIHTGGEALKTTFLYEERLYQQALSYAGLRSDGALTIQPSSRYEGEKDRLVECSGGGVIMLKDGKIPDLSGYPGNDPRTVIGYRGRTVCFLVVDGRQADWSNGLTYPELGSLMQALNCEAAVNLDGGGSTQLLVRNPATLRYEIRNRPSDGKERAVAETWMILTENI